MNSEHVPLYILLMIALMFSQNSNAVETQDPDGFKTYFVNEDMALQKGNDAIVGVGIGAHIIKAGQAMGIYLSGITPILNTNFGIYARAELIRDTYKTGHFWAWNTAIGAGYYINEKITTFITVGKCFSSYSTCYFNLRHPTANDDDIDAIYFGIGSYFKEPFFNKTLEVSLDWSPYKNYNGASLYLGYGFRF